MDVERIHGRANLGLYNCLFVVVVEHCKTVADMVLLYIEVDRKMKSLLEQDGENVLDVVVVAVHFRQSLEIEMLASLDASVECKRKPLRCLCSSWQGVTCYVMIKIIEERLDARSSMLCRTEKLVLSQLHTLLFARFTMPKL